MNLAKRAATKQLGGRVREQIAKFRRLFSERDRDGKHGDVRVSETVEKNGRKGVYIYLDEVGLLKGKAKNALCRRWRSRADFRRRFTGTYSLARCKRNRNRCVR